MIRPLGLVGVLLCLDLLFIRLGQGAPALTGLWLTQDHDGVIAISNCGGAVCARIVGVFLDHADATMPVDYRGASQCDLTLIADARQVRSGLWKGHITDPRNGDVWGVELHLDANGDLALRGFFGIPLLGRTQTWTRYSGDPPADCRIVSPGATTGPSRDLPATPGQAQ